MTLDQMIINYPDDDAVTPDLADVRYTDIGARALNAFANMVDNVATLSDLEDYRAWITYERLTGVDERALHSSLAVAKALAIQLGVE